MGAMSPRSDEGAPAAARPDGPRTPTGTATLIGFGGADELVAALIAAAGARLEAAIAERLWRREISDRGDAAATLFLDGARIAALLHGPGEPAPPELAQLRAAAERRDRALLRRLAATPDHGPPLSRAVRRWRLADDAIRLLAAALAAELSPRLARLAAFLGGDVTRPGFVVEGAAALLGAGEAGVAAAARQLAPGAPLHDLALVLLRAPDAPLLRRPLWIAPRLVELALGRAALDEAAGAALVAPPPPGSVAPAGAPDAEAARAAVLAVLRRPAAPVVGALPGGRPGALAALARVLDDAGAPLLVTELSVLAEEVRLGAIAIRVDVIARDAARAARAADRLAALAPVFLIGSGDHEPALPLAAGAIAIELPPPGRAELAAAIGGAFAGLLTAGEAERVAARAPIDLGAVPRAAAAIAAQPFPADRVAAVLRALADQLAPPADHAIRALPEPPPPPPALAAAVEAAARLWTAGPPPRRLRIIVDGRPGTGKTALAAAIAARLGLPAFAIDPPRPGRGPETDPVLAGLAAAAAANGAALVIENADLLGARRARPATDAPFALGWLGRLDGLVIVTTRDPLSNLERALRREFDLAITVPAPDAAERLRLWRAALGGRGSHDRGDPQGGRGSHDRIEPAELEALARDFAFAADEIERVVALAPADAAGLRREAERRASLAGGPRAGEVD
jgi:hypothetical protein